MFFAALAFLGAFVTDQGLLTYFADLSDPGLLYRSTVAFVSQPLLTNMFLKHLTMGQEQPDASGAVTFMFGRVVYLAVQLANCSMLQKHVTSKQMVT